MKADRFRPRAFRQALVGCLIYRCPSTRWLRPDPQASPYLRALSQRWPVLPCVRQRDSTWGQRPAGCSAASNQIRSQPIRRTPPDAASGRSEEASKSWSDGRRYDHRSRCATIQPSPHAAAGRAAMSLSPRAWNRPIRGAETVPRIFSRRNSGPRNIGLSIE